MVGKSAVFATLMASSAMAWTVPSDVQTFYNNVKDGGCNSFAGGKSNLNDGHGHSGFGFCTDTANVVYLSGTNSLGDMDVDCDGAHNCGGLSGDYQGGTSFDDTLSRSYGIETLDASIHQFSVLGTCDLDLEGTIQPLALVAVVCNDQLFYSVWGDTNGCDDDNFTGEASISLAQMCFPNEGLNGNNGHETHDVLYLAFTGSDAVVGPSDANWEATSASDFQNSLKAFGDSILTSKFGGSAPGGNTGGGSGSGGGTCSWAGHCAGAGCSSNDDCSDDLTCNGGVCGGSSGSGGGSTPPSTTCSWAGHCAGAECGSDDDCSDDLTCKSGVCGGSSTSGGNTGGDSGSSSGGGTCSWAGHCAGATCGSDDDCSDDLECKSGICGGTSCSWTGHCAGATCSSDDDCSDDLACKSGKCSA
ncbi:hypothetical protein AA313_de0203215 [Arthrobotrys entomopaga]|nr:hypothetical protein AA313_de0203215 [Arthrobotrys entomopaga]